MDDLLLLRIEERHIHFIAGPGVSMDGLHEANVLQTSDVVHGAKLGAVTGAFAGCVAGAAVVWYFAMAPAYEIATVLGMALFGRCSAPGSRVWSGRRCPTRGCGNSKRSSRTAGSC